MAEYVFHPAHDLFSRAADRGARREWAGCYSRWSVIQWRRLLFSDAAREVDGHLRV